MFDLQCLFFSVILNAVLTSGVHPFHHTRTGVVGGVATGMLCTPLTFPSRWVSSCLELTLFMHSRVKFLFVCYAYSMQSATRALHIVIYQRRRALPMSNLYCVADHCSSTEFQCVRATNTCISAAQQCDGISQCPDFSDESQCCEFCIEASAKFDFWRVFNGFAFKQFCASNEFAFIFGQLSDVSSMVRRKCKFENPSTKWMRTFCSMF